MIIVCASTHVYLPDKHRQDAHPHLIICSTSTGTGGLSCNISGKKPIVLLPGPSITYSNVIALATETDMIIVNQLVESILVIWWASNLCIVGHQNYACILLKHFYCSLGYLQLYMFIIIIIEYTGCILQASPGNNVL